MKTYSMTLLLILTLLVLSQFSICLIYHATETHLGTLAFFRGLSLQSVHSESYDVFMTPSSQWQFSVNSTHFSVYYNTTGEHATTHEYAQVISASLENSWTTEVVELSFYPPPDSYMRVYLRDLPTGTSGITNCFQNATGWHVKNMTIDIGMNEGLANVTCAHELFHTIQLSYDPLEADWILEGTATWMESQVYPNYVGSDSYVDMVDEYMLNPDRTITQLGADAVLFWLYFDENYGTDSIENIMRQTISKDGISAVNSTLGSKGTTFTKFFKEWTIANYLKDSSYANGQLFNPINTTQYNYNGTEVNHTGDTVDWGADYFEVVSQVIYLPVYFAGEQPHNLTRILTEPGSSSLSDFTLSSQHNGSLRLMQADTLDRVVIIVRSLGNETSSNKSNYQLKLLDHTFSSEGPFTSTSSAITLHAVSTSSYSLSTSRIITVVIADPVQSSSTQTFNAPASSSTQNCLDRNSTVVCSSGSQQSTEGNVNVTLPMDIAITGVIPLKSVVNQGLSLNITVSVQNSGDAAVTTNLTAYFDYTNIIRINGEDHVSINLPPEETTSFAISWNTTGLSKGNYTISASASPILGETNTMNNNLTNGWIIISMIGDITGPDGWPDGKCDIRDVALVASYFGDYVPPAPAICDLTGPTTGVSDGKIDIRDVALVAKYFGEVDP